MYETLVSLIIHLFLAYNIFPRGGHRNEVSYLEAFMIDSTLSTCCLHLGFLMIQHMIINHQVNDHFLPYGWFFTFSSAPRTLTYPKRRIMRILAILTPLTTLHFLACERVWEMQLKEMIGLRPNMRWMCSVLLRDVLTLRFWWTFLHFKLTPPPSDIRWFHANTIFHSAPLMPDHSFSKPLILWWSFRFLPVLLAFLSSASVWHPWYEGIGRHSQWLALACYKTLTWDLQHLWPLLHIPWNLIWWVWDLHPPWYSGALLMLGCTPTLTWWYKTVVQYL